MKQVLLRRGRIHVGEVPAPRLEPGRILVRTAYSLISAGTEISIIQNSTRSMVRRAIEHPDKALQVLAHLRQQGWRKTWEKVNSQMDGDTPIGYSCSGIVLAVGPEVDGYSVGDRVACGGAGYATHSEVVSVPRNLVVPVPEGCDLKSAASVTLGAIAMQGVRRADPRIGEVVAVIGLGLLGQITVQILKAAGCRGVGIDLDLRRVELARENGATRAYLAGEADPVEEVLQLTGRHGADATIITATSGESRIVQQAMEITRKKGKVVVVGAVGLGLERSPFYEKEIDFLISCSYGPGRYDEVYEERGLDYPYSYVRWTENRNMSEYLRLVAEGGVRIGPVLEREYDIDQAVSAYEELKTGASKPLGVLLRYPGAEGLRVDNAVLASSVRLRSVPAGGRIRVAVVGAGAFAKSVHLPNLKGMSDRYQIRAVVSATGSNAKSTAQQFGAEYAGTSYEEILADPEVDAVILCTHHHLHARQTVDALKAGKHVYCEKPLAMNEEELAQILGFYGLTVESAMEIPDGHLSLQPVLMVGYNRRFSPAIGKIREILRDRSNPLMSLYRVNAGFIPPGDWVQGPEGGGRILGEMCHMFDLFGFLTGAPAKAVSVEPMGTKMEQLSARDNLCATVRYEDSSVCTLLYSALGAPGLGKEYLEVHADGKSMVVDDFRSMRVFGSPIGGWKGITADKGHVKALEAFAEALKGGRGWPIPLRSLVDSARVTFTVDSAVK